MITTNGDLPTADSKDLELCVQSEEEKLTIWRVNGQTWRGRLSMEAYIDREEHLGKQALTRDGGITYWVLTDSTRSRNERPLLASCESIRKRALVKGLEGRVEEVITYGIGSVFCDPNYRGRGYARRMMKELGQKLDSWGQEKGEWTPFTVLYSDIGKKFYAQSGWEPYLSSHVALPPIVDTATIDVIGIKLLYTPDLGPLCAHDEKMLREIVEQSDQESRSVTVAIMPDIATVSWLHAREEYVSQHLLGRKPDVKGAHVKCSNGIQVWCLWACFFANESTEGNVLNILRIVIEKDSVVISLPSRNTANNTALPIAGEEQLQAVEAILRAAQMHAALWEMNDVQIWNPSPTVVAAAKKIDPSRGVIHRDDDSVASLRWHSCEDLKTATVAWIGNDKCGWC